MAPSPASVFNGPKDRLVGHMGVTWVLDGPVEDGRVAVTRVHHLAAAGLQPVSAPVH